MNAPLKQFVPPEYCAKCDVCCRFLDEETPLGPVGLTLKPHRDRFICCNFDPRNNRCKDYENQPLDCQIYPFVLMWDEDYRDIVLAIDPKCPFIQTQYAIRNTQYYINYFLSHLKDIDPKYISRFQDDVKILEKLDITAAPALNKLLIGDKALFEKYARHTENPLSTYSFIANYVWTALLDYYWMIMDDNFCLFCKAKDTIFMPIPPLGEKISGMAVKKCFELMNKINKNKNCSRIEDICGKEAAFYKGLGHKIKEKGQEYIYNRDVLAQLAGDRYKDKRALCNYFMKHYKYEYREYLPDDEKACLMLYGRWARERVKKGTVLTENCPQTGESYYRALLEDSYTAHKKAIGRFRDLGLAGRVVIVDNKISAYTFGYPLDNETFVVLLEVADLRVRGLSQFIFRRFCEELGDYKYINAMDDSGLDNLKKIKMSYHPVKIERTYCAYAPSPSYGGRLGKQEGLGA